MSATREFAIPDLATVTITDSTTTLSSEITIRLDRAYQGDLNDLAQHTLGPDDIYLSCSAATAVNSPLLAKFMEVLSHWDYDHDGIFDGDELVTAIDEAMWMSEDRPTSFKRPTSGVYTRLLMRLMPPAPERHIVYSFGELKERFRWYHYLLGAPAILAILYLINTQIEAFPFMKYSVVSGLMAAAGMLPLKGWALWIALVMLYFVYGIIRSIYTDKHEEERNKQPSSYSPHTYGFFNKAAVYEEQAFREGSEHWNTGQRLMSCLAFGAIHLTNLIYPLATILPLALGGALFMFVYLRVYRQTKFRRSAVLAAALVHRVYNRLALIAFALSLVLYFGSLALVHFGVFAALVLGARYIRSALPGAHSTPVRVGFRA